MEIMGWVGGGHLQSEALRVSVLPKSSHFLASEITALHHWVISYTGFSVPVRRNHLPTGKMPAPARARNGGGLNLWDLDIVC